MERSKIEEMKTLYLEHQKLHTVGDIMSIPWQTVYWWLWLMEEIMTDEQKIEYYEALLDYLDDHVDELSYLISLFDEEWENE